MNSRRLRARKASPILRHRPSSSIAAGHSLDVRHLVRGSFFLAGPQLKQMEGFDVKAALNTLLAFLGQSYLALLLVWFLGWLIYRRGYARGLQDGRVTERAWREEVQRKFGALRKRCGARLYGQATRLNHLSPTLETPARSWAGRTPSALRVGGILWPLPFDECQSQRCAISDRRRIGLALSNRQEH